MILTSVFFLGLYIYNTVFCMCISACGDEPVLSEQFRKVAIIKIYLSHKCEGGIDCELDIPADSAKSAVHARERYSASSSQVTVLRDSYTRVYFGFEISAFISVW